MIHYCFVSSRFTERSAETGRVPAHPDGAGRLVGEQPLERADPAHGDDVATPGVVPVARGAQTATVTGQRHRFARQQIGSSAR